MSDNRSPSTVFDPDEKQTHYVTARALFRLGLTHAEVGKRANLPKAEVDAYWIRWQREKKRAAK